MSGCSERGMQQWWVMEGVAFGTKPPKKLRSFLLSRSLTSFQSQLPWMDPADSLLFVMGCLHLSMTPADFYRKAVQIPSNLLNTADFQPGCFLLPWIQYFGEWILLILFYWCCNICCYGFYEIPCFKEICWNNFFLLLFRPLHNLMLKEMALLMWRICWMLSRILVEQIFRGSWAM